MYFLYVKVRLKELCRESVGEMLRLCGVFYKEQVFTKMNINAWASVLALAQSEGTKLLAVTV